MSKSILKIKAILLTTLIFSSCISKESEIIDGVWQSLGYGRIVKIQDGEFLLADVTNMSCNPALSGEISMFENNIGVENDTLFLKDGINKYQFVRIEDAPKSCKEELSEEQKSDPIYNYNVLAQTFTDHYAYFKERNINWKTLQETYKSKITSKTTNAELYNIMNEMLEQFNDGHIGLSAPDEVTVAANLLNDTETENNKPNKIYRRREVAKVVAMHYIDDIKSINGGILKWGKLDDDVGYIQLNQMMGYANYVKNADTLSTGAYWNTYFEAAEKLTLSKHSKNELDGVKFVMQKVMEDLSGTKAMVIDVRFNGGGKDEIALNILSHFNNKERIVFTKKAKTNDGFTKDNIIALASLENNYNKPVYLLIGGGSASATEIMTLASLSLENVTRIGSPTKGVFSDVLEKQLPNGWELGLSNEVYFDTNGINYEGKGISPDINISHTNDVQVQYKKIIKSLENNNGDETINKVLGLIN